MTVRTQRNLDIGMHAEAFSSAKYKRFAAFARTNLNNQFADLFMQIADDDRINHFAQELRLAGLIAADDETNLQDVIRDKVYQIERYKQFALEAEQDGDLNAAAVFKDVANDDIAHLHRLEATLSGFKARDIVT